jgi:hypothetical protein
MKLFLKNNIISKSVSDFTINDIDIYACCGGGYGDIILYLCNSGLFYMLEKDLSCKNILIYIWVFDYKITELFKNYNHNIYCCIETFNERDWLNNDFKKNLNEKFSCKHFDINKYYTIDSWFSNKQTPDKKYIYKGKTQFTPLEIENINIPIGKYANDFLSGIKKNKYIVICFYAGDQIRTIPYKLVQHFIDNIDNSYYIILLGNKNAVRTNLTQYCFSKKNKKIIDLIDKTPIDLSINIIKYADKVITSFSSTYVISALLNKKTLVFLPYLIVNHYREKEILNDYKYVDNIFCYYLFSNNCDTILFNDSTYHVNDLHTINATYCEIKDYVLEFNKIIDIKCNDNIKEIIKKIGF